jgi:hypothetical protein
VENHLTEQGLTITFLKKQMDTLHWPRLQKAGAAPYIRTDFNQWEGDQSDDIINARTVTPGPSLGTNNGQHFTQVIMLLTVLNA